MRTRTRNNLNHSRMLAAGLFAAALLLAGASAAVLYVDVNSTNATPPYTSWATAATNIQHAVNAAVAGDEIVVTNGIYSPVAVGKPLSLRSVNGPEVTSIRNGGLPANHVRCVYLTNGANLSGFTLTRGASYGDGAGIFCESQTAVVSNCVVSGNTAFEGSSGGGVCGGTLNNCTLIGNSADSGGAAIGCTLKNCTLRNNFASYGGGASGCILNNCMLIGNSAVYGGGAWSGTLNNCTLIGNSAHEGSDSIGYGGAVAGCTLNNCIAYFNTAAQGANYDSFSILNYSCTTPLPPNGAGNISNDPAFVNPASGNYRLRPGSPCIDAGSNLTASITNDLDGRPRPLDGNGDGLAAFDMGAYEYRPPLLVCQDSPNPSPPYTSWAIAATNIQDAVDAALAGDEIVVTNGIYATGGRAVDGLTTNKVAVDELVSLRSVNGPQFTSIDGGQSNRCVFLANGATLAGFTLTHGSANYGGGLFCESATEVVSNCVVSGNSASAPRGYYSRAEGGGAYGGTLNNCVLSHNWAEAYLLVEHGVTFASGGGASASILNNCILTGNRAEAYRLVSDDLAFAHASGGGANACILNNCTVTGNSVGGFHTSVIGGGASGCALNNCIVYFNTENYAGSTLNYSCTTPLPPNGVGNITNAPLFVDLASGNLRLQSNSPCINAGLNAYAPAGPDLEGNPRIAGVGGTVDMGTYEFQLPTSIISYAWLQQYALPTDGSADHADPDGDGLDNWKEWRCGTDPSTAISTLRLLAPTTLGSDLVVRWESVADRTYFLERSSAAASGFTPLTTNIPGQTGTTTFTDTNATGSGPFFYRVGIQ